MKSRTLAFSVLALGSVVLASACSVDAGVSGPPDELVCTDDGSACDHDDDCCGGLCDSSGTCSSAVAGCFEDNTACSDDSECCSTVCADDGYCGYPSTVVTVTCAGEADSCSDDSDCCSNACGSDGTCSGADNCTLDNDPCGSDSDCCSGVCNADDGFCGG